MSSPVKSTLAMREDKKPEEENPGIRDGRQEYASETESIRKRVPTETKYTASEDKKPEKPKMPVFVRVLSILHIILVAMCFVAIAHFYNEYVSKRQDSVESDKKSELELGKMMLSAVVAGLASFSRAYLIQRYE